MKEDAVVEDVLKTFHEDIPTEFNRAHILIVDDDATNRILLRSVCEKLGVGIVDEAENGEIAFDLIKRFRPDLVLLDIRMPIMDGWELMKLLRSDPIYDGMPILVQTGLQKEDDRVQCFTLGATDVVSRPFHLSELRARIKAHLRSALSARILFDFRNRIQAHIEITHSFLDAILPTPEKAAEIASEYDFDCSVVYQPHDEIGGDLWAMRRLDENTLSLVVMDASAHGLAGAINALRVDCLVQEYYDHLYEPGVFLNELDAAMAKISFGQLFAGAVAMTIDRQTGIIKYAGSGIPSPILIQGDSLIELKTRGMPLGSGLISLATTTATIEPGSSLVVFSDGWMDSLSMEPIKFLQAAKDRGAIMAKDLIPDTNFPDDLTLVTLQRRT